MEKSWIYFLKISRSINKIQYFNNFIIMGNGVSGEQDHNKVVDKSYKGNNLSRARLADMKRVWNMDSKMLGQGAYGKVYKATAVRDNSRVVAVKIINKRNLDDFMLENLENEIYLLNKVDHPHIAKYYETYDEENYIYMIMEFCPGGELYDKLLDDFPDGMPENDAKNMILKICKALLHCHDQNIMHRDLKPENIVFGADGEPKLIDFGFAKEHAGGADWLESVGSVLYMSPEALYGKYGKETDVWSMGVVIYHILTGECPFDDDAIVPSTSIIEEKIRIGSFNMPKTLSENAQDLLYQMINYKNEERITFAEVVVHPWFTEDLDPKDENKIDKDVLTKLHSFKQGNTLKNTVMGQLVKQLSQASTEELRSQFDAIDKDKNGLLDKKEIEAAFDILGKQIGCTKEEYEAIFKEVDVSGDGKINYQEFLVATVPLSKILTKEKISAIFKEFDADGDGQISAENIKKTFSKFGKEISELEINQILKSIDQDGDNQIDFDEFRAIFKIKDAEARQEEPAGLTEGIKQDKDQQDKKIEFAALPQSQEPNTKNQVQNQEQPLEQKKKFGNRKDLAYDDTDSLGTESEESEMEDPLIKSPKPKRNPLHNFKNFKTIFENLVKESQIDASHPIVSQIITYDSSRTVVITKQDLQHFKVKMYDLESYQMVFEEHVEGKYIKMSEVEQNESGNLFALVYLDDGVFKFRNFGKEQRGEQEVVDEEVNLNKLIGIDDWTMAIDQFNEPFASCCYVDDETVFISLFHNYEMKHYHFLLDLKSKWIKGQVVSMEMEHLKKNYPIKCFYNKEQEQIYALYRQGESFIIDRNNISKYVFSDLMDQPVGQAYLVYNQILLIASSDEILFFRMEVDILTKEENWKLYHTEHYRGFISYIRGNVRMQLITEDIIYFFLLDKETLMPRLENVMLNYMKCRQMIYGPRVRYCITYKPSERFFTIYRRKYLNSFKSPLIKKNLEGSKGLEIKCLNAFLVTQIDKVYIYDSSTFQRIDQLDIKLLKSEEREPNEVIAIQKCQNEKYLGVITGKNLIKSEQKINQLFIFKNNSQSGRYELHKRCVVKDNNAFKQVCMQFFFLLNDTEERDSMIFSRIDQIFKYNFETETVSSIFTYSSPMEIQPQFFATCDMQVALLVCSPSNSLYINTYLNVEYDVDDKIEISHIKVIGYDIKAQDFYMLCNKYQGKLGLFLVKFSAMDFENLQFLIRYENKLDIDDGYFYVLNDKESGVRELVLSYKTIFMNIHTILSIDINTTKDCTIIFMHESFQLWESQMSSFMLTETQDMITLNRDGVSVSAIGFGQKKAYKDDQGDDIMIHPYEGYTHLKISPNNYLLYSCQNLEKQEIQIWQEYLIGQGDNTTTKLEKVYSVPLYQITLREILLCQSLYFCKTLDQLIQLTQTQPKPDIFYKAFLELDGSNMTSILSFESKSMKYLLNDNFVEYFSEDKPIFYKNKLTKGSSKNPKFFFRNAIESAIKLNQTGSVVYIIDYLVKYQNNYVTSFLLNKALPKILEMGINTAKLFGSNIFQMEFDYDEWPSIHINDETVQRPYNESLFHLRQNYSTIFPDKKFEPIELDGESDQKRKYDSDKIYKIKYTVNLLPVTFMHIKAIQNNKKELEKTMVNEDNEMMKLLAFTDEYEVFNQESIVDIVDYKWEIFGFNFHFVGFVFTIINTGIMMFYVQQVYIKDYLHDIQIDQQGKEISVRVKQSNQFAFLLFFGSLHPLIYSLINVGDIGCKKFLTMPKQVDSTVYFDFLFSAICIFNAIEQEFVDPMQFYSKTLMITMLAMQTLKFTQHLRVISAYSPLVQMLIQVFKDLTPFLIMFSISLLLLSLVLGIIELDYDSTYEDLNFLVGNFIETLRISAGDFYVIDRMEQENTPDSIIYLFFVCWFILLVFLAIVFLNFIIAEASASYQKINEKLNESILLDRCKLINEAERLQPKSSKSETHYPKYLVKRQIQF